jgi:hypothetical protein
MVDTKISGLTAVTTPVGASEFPVNESGTSKKITLTQVNAYCEPVSASSTAAQTLGTSDTYLTGSGLTITPARLQAGAFYRCKIDMTKTAAGVATATTTLRMGTLGTTSDAAICLFTFPSAQTAAIDNGFFEVLANFRSVGSGTSAVVEGVMIIHRTNTTTGFLSTSALQFMAPIRVTSSGFNSTTVTKIGVSINAGASSAWTTQLVQADLLNVT